MNKPIGVGLLVAGILLIAWGINTSESFSSEMSEFFTGSPSDKAIWLFVLGTIASVAGLILSLKPSRNRSG